MKDKITREDFATPEGRKRAWRELMLGDHGFLRKIYDNTHEVAPGKLWRTYQPSPAKLKKWRDRGVKTVINLRGDGPSGFLFLEEEACDKLGMTHIPFRVFSREAPSKEVLCDARKLFDEIEYPAIMHCKSGADRVGLMATLYLFLHEGISLPEAMEHLSLRYGHVRQGKTGIIDEAFHDYIEYATMEGEPLTNVDDFFYWVDNIYDPVRVKQNFRGNMWGNFLTEKVFRRE